MSALNINHRLAEDAVDILGQGPVILLRLQLQAFQKLLGMVVLRQMYLAWAMTDHPRVENIYFCYPLAWVCTALLVTGYYLYVRGRYGAEAAGA